MAGALIYAANAAVPVGAQQSGREMQQALDLFYSGQWEQATESLYDLLSDGTLSKSGSKDERSFS